MNRKLQRIVVSILLGVGMVLGFKGSASSTVYSFQKGDIKFVTGPHDSTDTQSPYYQLYKFLQSAKNSIYCSCYEFNIESLARLLADKSESLPVQIVLGEQPRPVESPTESDHPWNAYQILKNSPVEITIAQNQYGIMHNKFCVVDSQKVWTGSANFTYTSMFRDYNNGVMLKNPQVALDYLAEFKEERNGHFGSAYAPNSTPYPEVDWGSTVTEVYFAPEDKVQSQILSEIQAATKSIDFMIYAFSSEKILQAILDRMTQGIKVRGIFDDRYKTSDWSEKVFDALKEKGAKVKYDDSPSIVHHKVMIIDRKIVITGSYNFSQNAEKENDENVVIIHNPKVAQRYSREFRILWDMF